MAGDQRFKENFIHAYILTFKSNSVALLIKIKIFKIGNNNNALKNPIYTTDIPTLRIKGHKTMCVCSKQTRFLFHYLQLGLRGGGGQEGGLPHEHLEENHADAPPVAELSVPWKTGMHPSQRPARSLGTPREARPRSMRVMQKKTDLHQRVSLHEWLRIKAGKGTCGGQ